ncbi:MAG: hypothetical protein WCI57_02065 [Candidatus Berkelbacteria bacterium]
MTRNSDQNSQIVAGPKKTISVGAVLGYMAFLFLIFVTFMIWFRYSNFSPLADWYEIGIKVQKVDLRSMFNDKANSDSASNKVEMKVTEEQLAEAAAVTKSSFPLKKASLKIVPAGVEVEGKMTDKIWDFMTVKITLKPIIKDDAVSFDIIKIEASGVQAPPKVTDLITPKIDYIFANLLPKNAHLKLTNVYSMQGFLRIEGEKVAAEVPVN